MKQRVIETVNKDEVSEILKKELFDIYEVKVRIDIVTLQPIYQVIGYSLN